jgi:rhodanese-related sulfurtransferase
METKRSVRRAGEPGRGIAGTGPATQPNILKSSLLHQGEPVDFFLENWILFAVAIASGLMLLWPVFQGGAGGAGLSPTDAVQLINREKAVVVDVCSAEEYAAGHIKGARNVPLDELEQRLPAVAKNKATPLILVCASGVRSRRAVALARRLGYERVHSLQGGMAAWRSASLPIEKNG